MIERFDLEEGECAVVNEHDLSNLTRFGWTLVAMVQETELRHEGTTKVIPDSNGYGNTFSETVIMPVTVTKYLVRRSKDATWQELQTTIEAAQARNVEAAAEIKELEDKIKGLEDHVESKQSMIETIRDREQVNEKRVCEARANAQRMEADLGKLREHFGRKAFDEALSDGE